MSSVTVTTPSGITGIDIAVRQGDTAPIITATLLNNAGVAVSLSGAVVTVSMRHQTSRVLAMDRQLCVIVSAPAGTISYTWTATDTYTAGIYDLEFIVTFASGLVESFPNNSYLITKVLASIDSGSIPHPDAPANPTVIADDVALADEDELFDSVTLEGALEELARRGNSITYRPGGVATGNIKTTWTTAHAAAEIIQPCRMWVDSRSGQPSIPVDTDWDIKEIEVVGIVNSGGALPTLQIEQGGTLTNLGRTDCVRFEALGDSPVVTVPVATLIRLDAVQTYFDSEGGVPFFKVESGGFLVLAMSNIGGLSAGTIQVDAGGTCFIGLFGCALPDGVITGDGDVFVDNYGGAAVSAVQSTMGVPGSYTVTNFQASDGVTYTAGTPAHWATAPVSAQAAIDRLAAAVYALRSNVAIP
jgi:hypothetical protein